MYEKACEDLRYTEMYAKLASILSSKHPDFSISLLKHVDANYKRLLESGIVDGRKKETLTGIVYAGQLFNCRIVDCKMMDQMVMSLFCGNNREVLEPRLEMVCALLGVIGKQMDDRCGRGRVHQYLQRVKKNEKKLLSNRIKHLLKEVSELRDNNWNPRWTKRDSAQLSSAQKLSCCRAATR